MTVKTFRMLITDWEEAFIIYERTTRDFECQDWVNRRYAHYVRQRGKSCDTWALLKAMEDYKQEVELASMKAAAEEYELAMAAQEIIGGN